MESTWSDLSRMFQLHVGSMVIPSYGNPPPNFNAGYSHNCFTYSITYCVCEEQEPKNRWYRCKLSGCRIHTYM